MPPRKPSQLARRAKGGAVSKADTIAAALERIPGPDRARLLHLAGFDERKLVDLLQRAVAAIEGKLAARVVTRMQVMEGRGVGRIEEFVDDDLGLQLRAATELLAFLGAYPGKAAPTQAEQQDINIQVNILGSKAEPPVVEVLPSST